MSGCLTSAEYSPYDKETAENIIRRIARLYIEHEGLNKQEAIKEGLGFFRQMQAAALSYNSQQIDLSLSEPFQTKENYGEAIEQIIKLRAFTQRHWKVEPEHCGFDDCKLAAERAFHGLSELLCLLQEEMAAAPEHIESEPNRSGPKVKACHQRIIEICVNAYECSAGFVFNEAIDRNSHEYKQHSKALNELATLALSALPTQSDEAIRRMVQRVTRALPAPLFIDIEL